MNPVAKALWFIESHLDKDITLDDVAETSGVSRFHMSRAFGAVLNCSVMQYVRARRLSEAARRLADGAPDILSVALDAGYGSHEAFTRAFRDRFGLTPEQVRANGRTETLTIWEPVLMEKKLENALQPPRFVDGKPMLIVGLGARFDYDNMDGLPALWQRFQRPYRPRAERGDGRCLWRRHLERCRRLRLYRRRRGHVRLVTSTRK